MSTKKSKAPPADPDYSNLPDDSRACLQVLKKLEELALQGRLQGFAYGVTFVEDNDSTTSFWDVDAVGHYRNFPIDAVATVNILARTVEKWAQEQ